MNDATTTDTYTGLQLEKCGHTTIVTLNNPPAHTWTVQSLCALVQSPSAVRACKRLIQGARSGTPQQTLVAERAAFSALFDTDDWREGVSAFLEKRAPVWKNG